jgi:hypothetical protein
MRLRVALLAGVLAAAASAADLPVDPGKIAMQATPAGLKVKLAVRKGSVDVAAGESPLLAGAVVHLFNTNGTGDAVCAAMPASNWKVKGAASWSYSDAGNVLGPVRRAHFGAAGKHGSDIRLLLKGPSPYTLDERQQGSVGLTFRVQGSAGDTVYCTDFAPPYAYVTRDSVGKYRALWASPTEFPGPCPTAPSPCSPGGVFLDPD